MFEVKVQEKDLDQKRGDEEDEEDDKKEEMVHDRGRKILTKRERLKLKCKRKKKPMFNTLLYIIYGFCS